MKEVWGAAGGPLVRLCSTQDLAPRRRILQMLRSFLAPGARTEAFSRESTTFSRRCMSAAFVSRIAVPRTTIKGVNGHMERFLLAISGGLFLGGGGSLTNLCTS